MRLGFLSDAHGNVEGFSAGCAVLARAGVDRVYFLGDAVGYLPGAGVVDAIAARRIEAIAGNHEAMLLAGDPTVDDAVFRFAETRRDLGPDGLARIASWPTRRELDTAVGPVLLVHDSPFAAHRRIYPDSDLSHLPRLEWKVVCMGHTHRPFVRRAGRTTFVNVGSCGLPRDDGSLGSVATLDTDTGDARVLRFDLRAATRQALARVGPVHHVVTDTLTRRERPHATARARSAPPRSVSPRSVPPGRPVPAHRATTTGAHHG